MAGITICIMVFTYMTLRWFNYNSKYSSQYKLPQKGDALPWLIYPIPVLLIGSLSTAAQTPNRLEGYVYTLGIMLFIEVFFMKSNEE